MAEKMAIVGDMPLVTGFKLAGVSSIFPVEKGEEFEKKLTELMASGEYGIIVVNETFLSDLDWRLKKKISNLAHPVIIGVPGISGEAEVEEGESINVLIKRALGFDISKK